MKNKYCCPQCFGDIDLELQIFPSLNPIVGNCDFCYQKNAQVLEPFNLIDSFQPLVDIYKEDAKGEPLVKLLKKDWKLFENPELDELKANSLLEQILGEKKINDKKFVLDEKYVSTDLKSWEAFKEEIMYKNRWFIEKVIDLEQLESFFSSLIAKQLSKKWYRARLLKGKDSYKPEEMGAPPKTKANSGRANPAGIPYLYLASSPETALAEVRAHNNEKAAVAEFTIENINVIDLTDPRKRISPFILQDSTKIGTLLAELPLLENLGNELSCPVLPFEADINYTPSQYLCEFIKLKNYDGVLFNSSVSSGQNLALFDTNKKSSTIKIYTAEVSVTVIENKTLA